MKTKKVKFSDLFNLRIYKTTYKMSKIIKLGFNFNNSNKVYNTEIVEVDKDRYQVKYTYGKRWNVINTYIVPVKPVNLEEAIHIRDKQVAQKIKKGYIIEEKY